MSEEELKVFRGKLKNIRRKLTLLDKFIETIDEPKDFCNEIKLKLDSVKVLENKIGELFDNWITAIVDSEEDVQQLEGEANQVEERCFAVESKLISYLNGVESDKSKVDNQQQVCGKLFDKPRIKLPDIQLPKFDGALDKWVTFRDIFTAMIVNTESIPPVQKFVYLNGNLEGEAKKLIDKIPLSEIGFDLSWCALTDRYDQNKLIVFKHISELFSTKPVQKDSLNDLRSLIDDCRLHFRVLQNLNQPVEYWDMVIIFFVVQRLGNELRKLWESETKDNKELSFEDLMEFLNGRCNVLQSIVDAPPSNQSSSTNKNRNLNSNSSSKTKSFHSKSESPTCHLCSKKHYIDSCKRFLSLSPKARYEKIKELHMCLKCFRSGHSVRKCHRPSCKICRLNHHELLHFLEKENSSLTQPSSSQHNISQIPSKSNENTVSMSCKNDSITSNQVLIPTAVILIADHQGNYRECRALLDSGSQSNLMSKKMANTLQLESKAMAGTVLGLNNLATTIRKRVNSTIKSRVKNFSKTLQFLVVLEISSYIPNEPFDISMWNLPKHLLLADNLFNITSEVDVILGAEVFFECFKPSKKSAEIPPIFKETEFGLIAAGSTNQSMSSNCFFLSNVITDEEDLNRQVRMFWEQESCNTERELTTDEKQCENNFEQTSYRNPDGRFVVSLPFRESYRQLGESRMRALKRFTILENKLSKNSELKKQYSDFMKEYESLGHMSPCHVSHPFNQEFFLPHHAVLRPDSSTTKLRVVFDASASSTSGLSLNDVLLVGPKLQDELFDLILRFRRFPIVFTADIEKMYRQILVNSQHVQYQKILWRENPNDEIQEYQLQTVTYGIPSAPYLATKVLQQLSKEVANSLPLASAVLRKDFYMDDLLSGCNSISEAEETIRELNVALQGAGMRLRKWSSNTDSILSSISNENKSSCSNVIKVIKTLGLIWDPVSDLFSFEVKEVDAVESITKRTVLADVARLFDPLGQLGPVVFTAKMFIQSLWI